MPGANGTVESKKESESKKGSVPIVFGTSFEASDWLEAGTRGHAARERLGEKSQ